MAVFQLRRFPASRKLRFYARIAILWGLSFIWMLLSACAGSGNSALSTSAESANAIVEPVSEASAPSTAELTQLLLEELARLGIDPDNPHAAAALEDATGVTDKQASADYGIGSGRALAFKVDTLSFTGWSGDPDGPEGAAAPTTGTLQWVEQLTGDYDQNGEVGMADIAPLAQFWGRTVEYAEVTEDGETRRVPAGDPLGDGALNWRLARVDGNGDGEISAQDLVPLAQSFGLKIYGYDVCWLVPGWDGYIGWGKEGSTRPATEPEAPVVYTYELDFSVEPQALFLQDDDFTSIDGWYSTPLNAPPPGQYFVRAMAVGPQDPIPMADSNIAEVRYYPPAVASSWSSYALIPQLEYNTCEKNYFDSYNGIEFELSSTGMYEYRYCSEMGFTYSRILRNDPLSDTHWGILVGGYPTHRVENNSASACSDGSVIGTCTDTSYTNGTFTYSNRNPVYLYKLSPAGVVDWQVKLGFANPENGAILPQTTLSRSCSSFTTDAITLVRSIYFYAPYYWTTLLTWQNYDFDGVNQLTRAYKFSVAGELVEIKARDVSIDSQGYSRVCGEIPVVVNETDCQALCSIAFSPDGEMLTIGAAVLPNSFDFVDIKSNPAGESFMLLKPKVEEDSSLVLVKFDAASQFAWARSCDVLLTSPRYFLQLGITPAGLPVVCGTGNVAVIGADEGTCLRPMGLLFSQDGELTRQYCQQYVNQNYSFNSKINAKFCGVTNDPATGELCVLSYNHDYPLLCWELAEPPVTQDVLPLAELELMWQEYALNCADEPGELVFQDVTDICFEPAQYAGEDCWAMPLPVGE